MIPVVDFNEDAATKALTAAPPWGSSAPYMALVMMPFTPGPTLVLSDLTLATFTGNAAKVAGAVVPVFYSDPSTGDYIGLLVEPAGGWKWTPSDGVNLPQTIYGYACLNNAKDTLLATQLFDPPLLITAPGQLITIGDVEFRVNSQFIF